MIALFIIIPIIVLIGAGIWCGIVSYKKYDDGESKALVPQIIISALFCLASILVLVFVPGSFHQVDAGEVAVVKVWGDAKFTRQAGLHFDLWISHKYDIYDAKVQQIVTTTQTYSNDGQTMDVELVIQYKIQQDKAMKIADTYGGLQMLESRIETVAINEMKGVLAKKSAMNIIETRATVSSDVTKAVTDAIKDGYYADITTVVLTDISFTDAFEKTVEDKMIAEQEKLKAEYEKEKAIIQAEQALEVAKLDAEAKLAAAKGDANAQKAIADAEAYSTSIKIVELARTLGYEVTETPITEKQTIKNTNENGEETETVVEVIVGYEYEIDWSNDTDGKGKQQLLNYLQYLEYLAKWNGELPDVVTGSDASIFIPVIK